MNASDRLRIGAVSYLNALPLTITLRDDPRVDLREEVPSAVADGLASGRFDVGLVPVIDVLRHPEWDPVPELCIASRGPVETVLLVSRVPFEAIDRIGLDTASRTSAVLVRIVMRERFGVDPEAVPATPAEAPPDAPAWLVIGDPAFAAAEEPEVRTLDLGAAWHALTGRPMVYAIWACRAGLDADVVGPVLHEARHAGLRTLPSWLGREADRRGLDRARCERYLRDTICHVMGPDEEAGLRELERRAREADLL